MTLIELAAEMNIDIPETSAGPLIEWIACQSSSGSLVDYLKTFDITVAVMQSREALRRIAREFVEDLVEDGVVYGEVRWAPELHTQRGLTMVEAVGAVQQGINDGIEDSKAGGNYVDVRQILSAIRHSSNSLEVAKLALKYREETVVGFDIAGREDGFPASSHTNAFTLLASEFFPVTIHAGEAAGLPSIRSALLDGRAIRLGHGVRIAEDINGDGTFPHLTNAVCGELASWVRDRRIPLELSPTSNLQTGATAAWGPTLESHPFDLLYRLGFTVTVNVDNRTMSSTSMTRELQLLVETHGYGIEDLKTFQLNAAGGAFLPIARQEHLVELIAEKFAALVGDNAPTDP